MYIYDSRDWLVMYARMRLQLDGEGSRRAIAKSHGGTEMPLARVSLAVAFATAVFCRCVAVHGKRTASQCDAAAVTPLRSPGRAPFLSISQQRGVSLLEVMIAVLVLAVGILGAASLQLNAIRYSASAGYSTQASVIASDLLDRMRANSASLENYAVSIEGDCTRSKGGGNIAVRDLADFTEAVTCYLPRSTGAIVISGDRATISISWFEARTVADAEDTRFVVSSVVR